LTLPVSKFEAITDLSADASVDASAEDQFAPLDALKTAIRFWWFLSLLAILGGGVGWLTHRMQPPLYEAVARFSASIDYVSTGPLTQYEEDVALLGVGVVINSDDVVQAAVERAEVEGIHTDPIDLQRAAVLERRVNVWELRVRNADPRKAQRLANLWAEQGQAALLEGYQHALKADQIHRYLLSLESCLSEAAASEPTSAQCSRARFAQIQAELGEAGKALYQERLDSQGLFAGMTIGPLDLATLPDRPVLYQRNQVVLAGCLIGFLLGAVLMQLGIPACWLAGWRRRS
jgi:hypothetical protein